MTIDKGIFIRNIYYMLTYVTILFSALTRMFPKPTFAP